MHILITGAGGMLGRKLAGRLIDEGRLGNADVRALTLADVLEPAAYPHFRGEITRKIVDLSVPGTALELVASRPDVIFHLAAVVSGEAEADFSKGYRTNLDGTRLLFEAIRQTGAHDSYHPRVIFASSIAVFGEPLPDVISDDFVCTPLTSYGTQKAICELLLADYSRRGFFDGIGVRLPTICIRPGLPNRAASGFFSSILREPLVGREAVLPVGDDVRHWFASPRAGVGFLVHAACIDLTLLGSRRTLSLPGVSATVGDQLAALRRIAGDKALRLVRREPDETIKRIVENWPRTFDPKRALALGFRAESSFDEIIRAHIDDELGGAVP